MFKYCIVPSCLNSTYNMPRKLFISVPKNPELRIKWCRAIKRQSALFSPKSTLFVCEDHFNLREDLENYVRFSLMGGKLHIKKNVVPHIFSEIKSYTSQIDLKIVDTYNKKLIKCSDNKQSRPRISVLKSPQGKRLEPEPGEVINIYDSNIEIKEHIQDNIIGIKEELENSSSSVAEYNYVFIKTECGDNIDKTESILKETDSRNDFTNNMFIKSECEETDEQIGTEYNEMDSTNMSIKTEYENDTNDCILSGPDENIVYIKMESNTDDQFVERLAENKNEYQALPYSNRNIIIVTNGFDTTADENIIENNILIEETNNIITYRQNEFVCTSGEIQYKSSHDNNKMLGVSDKNQYQCTGLFYSDHWLADWFVTCMVPQCSKTKKYNPNTRFFKSPKDTRWETWLKAIYLNPEILEHKTTYYICEDHFDLPNDLENWENYQKNREHPKMKAHVLPSPAVVHSEMVKGGCGRKKNYINIA